MNVHVLRIVAVLPCMPLYNDSPVTPVYFM